MEKSNRKLARVLWCCLWVLLVCNILALAVVPALAPLIGQLGGIGEDEMQTALQEIEKGLLNLWGRAFQSADSGVATGTMFFCGICTAVIIFQGIRVLNSILAEQPFSQENAANLARAAVCCFGIAAAAAVRLLWSLWSVRNILPVFSYNALFIPTFLLGGLLFLVMSQLFQGAAEIKDENDLTI